MPDTCQKPRTREVSPRSLSRALRRARGPGCGRPPRRRGPGPPRVEAGAGAPQGCGGVDLSAPETVNDDECTVPPRVSETCHQGCTNAATLSRAAAPPPPWWFLLLTMVGREHFCTSAACASCALVAIALGTPQEAHAALARGLAPEPKLTAALPLRRGLLEVRRPGPAPRIAPVLCACVYLWLREARGWEGLPGGEGVRAPQLSRRTSAGGAPRGHTWRTVARRRLAPPPARAPSAEYEDGLPLCQGVGPCARGLVPGGAPGSAESAKGREQLPSRRSEPPHTLWDRFARRASRRVRHACSEVGAPHVTLHVGYLCACGTAARAHWWDTPDGAPRAAH